MWYLLECGISFNGAAHLRPKNEHGVIMIPAASQVRIHCGSVALKYLVQFLLLEDQTKFPKTAGILKIIQL